jgi:pilus assembly protein Flp/PilA
LCVKNIFTLFFDVASSTPGLSDEICQGRQSQLQGAAWDQGVMTMIKFLKLIRNNEGATAIEYGLIAALIAVAAIGAMQGIGNKLNTTFNNVSNHLS